MKAVDLENAIAYAKRFIQEAEACEANAHHPSFIQSGQQAAATKRASMDLTRALAKLRRPD